MNKLSIAIPAYNQPDNLRQCLKSIANQTMAGQIEVFVFDDNGPNSLEDVVKEFPGLNITYIKNKERLSAAGNIIQAINYAYQTPYVMIFHHDDVMHPKMTKTQINILEKDSSLLWAGTGFKFTTPDKMQDFSSSVNQPINTSIYKDKAELALALLKGTKLAFGSVVYRAKALKLGTIDYERFSAISDRPYLVEIASHGPTAFIKNELMNYRTHPEQDSKINSDIGMSQGIELMRFYKEQLPKPLNWKDKRVFYVCSTNNLLDAYLRMGPGKPSLKDYVKQLKKEGVFSLWYLNRIGIRAILKSILEKI